MKLKDLVQALASEIEAAGPELEDGLALLAELELEDPNFLDALDAYSGQAQRIGEAAEMAGFPGLAAVCTHVAENTLLLASQAPAQRGPSVEFLFAWPVLVVHYLRNLEDPSASAGLVDHLVRAPSPLEDDQALKLAHMLGAMQGQMSGALAGNEPSRPVLATPQDVALDIPGDVDNRLLEGFFTEAPGQARNLVELARKLASGHGTGDDLPAAKRVAHTLKGSGAIIGLRGLTVLGHHLEDILEHFEHEGGVVGPAATSALLDAAYCLEQMVDHVLGNDDYPQQAQAVLQAVLDLANRIDRGEDVGAAQPRVAAVVLHDALHDVLPDALPDALPGVLPDAQPDVQPDAAPIAQPVAQDLAPPLLSEVISLPAPPQLELPVLHEVVAMPGDEPLADSLPAAAQEAITGPPAAVLTELPTAPLVQAPVDGSVIEAQADSVLPGAAVEVEVPAHIDEAAGLDEGHALLQAESQVMALETSTPLAAQQAPAASTDAPGAPDVPDLTDQRDQPAPAAAIWALADSIEAPGSAPAAPVLLPLPPFSEPGSLQPAVVLNARPASSNQPQAQPSAASALRVPVEQIDEMFRTSGEISVHTAAMEARMKALGDAARQLLAQNLRVQKRLFELETVIDVRSLSVLRTRGLGQAGEQDGAAPFDPLEMDQYSEMHSTAHALMEEAADARALANKLEEEIARTVSVQAVQQHLAKTLQHLVMGTRLTPVAGLASRLHRNVRNTCQATGKQAELMLQGGDTLIDGDVLSRLAEPLLHMLRNAVDHGLETPTERVAAGKPEQGRIELSFSRQGQQVVLRCQDDGRGLDHAAIRRRAIERGLLTPEQTPSDDELARLILVSGFSTRQVINELSGRGVGMDVVREWATAMNGSIRLISRPGQGCLVELRFAASLSSMHVLIVEAAGQRFALPSVQVERALPRGVGHFEWVADKLVYRLPGSGSGGDEGSVRPAVRLTELAGLGADSDAPLAELDAVLVRLDERITAVAVERLLDAREVLIKGPGRYVRHVHGVAGLSILGDASVAVNLDLPQLLARAPRRQGAAVLPATAKAAAAPRSLPGVLIVDDALSVRNALQQMAQDNGYTVATARDGLEAAAALASFKPDLVLTDLEMPNMNGIELTAHIRGQAAHQHLPVLMITSRSQDKHRRAAEAAGVDAYITKPYNDAQLLQAMADALAAVAAGGAGRQP